MIGDGGCVLRENDSHGTGLKLDGLPRALGVLTTEIDDGVSG
ncbi:hypothetical protein [Nocardia salmonicida]|nr:hypothetical protein [Nocardia salmonicida]